jgi:hypothetical protein
MEPGEAALRILEEASEPLHWTVVWDRALRARYIDPMTQPEARDELVRWLAQAARTGEIDRTSTGTYLARRGDAP